METIVTRPSWDELRSKRDGEPLICPWCRAAKALPDEGPAVEVARFRLRRHIADAHGVVLRTGRGWDTNVNQGDLDRLYDWFQDFKARTTGGSE